VRIGSLFSGYGGLDRGVQAVLGGEVVWHSDIDKGSCKLLEHRFPGVPNLGDISTVDWSHVEPVDVLTGGFPCQDVSAAGKRAGIRPGTRSGLWTQFAYAIAQLRPRLVVIENVRGLLSAKAHSDVEPCAWCLGDDTDGALRALGAVLGDLADLGYDASWHGLRAADVGAPHGRFRVFVVAYPEHAQLEGVGQLSRLRGGSDPRPELRVSPLTDDRLSLLPTPRAGDGEKGGPNQRGSSGDLMLPSAVALLPTPSVADGEGGHERRGGARGEELLLNGVAKSFALLPTPVVADSRSSRQSTAPNPRADNDTLSDVNYKSSWGDYASAIARWEALTRPAPAPTMTSSKGNPQLAPAFVEWMMGLPAGWITDVPGLSRNDMLKLCGNGVVPQQAEAALRLLLAHEAVAA
jgi:DNA (cytosine-5)-methyltransferase 1